MEARLPAWITVSALALGVSACTPAERALNNPPGQYERTVSSTDADGTTTKQKSSTEVEVDGQGNKTAVVKSTTTKDPKGLFNKTTVSRSEQATEER